MLRRLCVQRMSKLISWNLKLHLKLSFITFYLIWLLLLLFQIRKEKTICNIPLSKKNNITDYH